MLPAHSLARDHDVPELGVLCRIPRSVKPVLSRTVRTYTGRQRNAQESRDLLAIAGAVDHLQLCNARCATASGEG